MLRRARGLPAIHADHILGVLLLLSLTGARGYLMESGPQAKIRKVETTQVWKVWYFNTIRFLQGWIKYGSIKLRNRCLSALGKSVSQGSQPQVKSQKRKSDVRENSNICLPDTFAASQILSPCQEKNSFLAAVLANTNL